jgi:micrococcal nuclease
MGQGSLAEEAQLFLEKLTKDKEVIIETDIQERDQFGRLLAYIYLDKKLINTEIVKEGFAKVYPVPPNVKHSDDISKAQIEARSLGKGIWYQKSINGEENNPDKITKTNKPYKNKFNIKRKLVHINEWSKTYHKPGCKFYNCKNCTKYMSEDAAITKGFKKCSQES